MDTELYSKDEHVSCCGIKEIGWSERWRGLRLRLKVHLRKNSLNITMVRIGRTHHLCSKVILAHECPL